MKKATEHEIIECAKSLMKNTSNIYLMDELSELIYNGNAMENYAIYKVVKKIAEDGFDISAFGLKDIPHPSVYCFGSKDNTQFFDVYLNCFTGGEEEVTVGFVNSCSCTENAPSIFEAVNRFCYD